MAQNSDDIEDVDKIMSQCSFTSASYAPSATALVSGISVEATKPATTLPGPSGSASTAGAAASTESADNGAGRMAISAISAVGAGLMLLLQF
ncbi:hypothetical protein IWW34DRAFT_231960 [Fusarium oxysporum f. sp. albedinis]|nr:hypothetical protein IWW34DRAFT_231960 [Fusarium oxysporum f. sp. albedinis]